MGSEIQLGAKGVTNLTIDGAGATVTVSGQNNTRLFEILGGSNDTINNLTLSNGFSSLNLTHDGGAVLVDQNAELTLSGDTFSGNQAWYEDGTGSGGALANLGIVNISGNTTFANNTAQSNGGAIENLGLLNIPGTPGSVGFTNNTAGENGGAIYSNSGGSGNVAVVNASFWNNTAQKGNGGALDTMEANALVNKDTFNYNTAGANGGAIANEDEPKLNVPANTLNVTDSAFLGNEAGKNGGAIENFGTLKVSLVNGLPPSSTWMFAGNTAQGNGGAIDSDAQNANVIGGSLSVSSSANVSVTFNSNQAVKGSGGAINTADNTNLSNAAFGYAIEIGKQLFVYGNTAGDNGGAVSTATDDAGAVVNPAATLTVTNCKFGYNSETGTNGGGGIFTQANTTVVSSLFSHNEAVNGGGIEYSIRQTVNDAYNSKLDLEQDYFYNNTASSGGGGACYSVIVGGGTVTVQINDCTFARNSTNISGGGLNFQQAMVNKATGSASSTLVNDTFWGNGANTANFGTGGAIAISDLTNPGSGTNTVSLTSLTVYQNGAAESGGGLSVANGTVSVDNCIFDGNNVALQGFNGPLDVDLGAGAPLTDLGFNLVDPSDSMFNVANNDIFDFNPGLSGVLAQNGASWLYPPTLALSTDSPGYKKGDLDQTSKPDARGFLRLENVVSIGAEDPDALLLQQGQSSTSIQTSASPALAGQPVSFTAYVTVAGSPPTGTVTFYDGDNALGTATVVNGQATLTDASLALGSQNITATYSGDSNYSGSSGSLTQVISQETSAAISLSSSANPATPNQAVTFTVAVSGGSGTPTGSVTFVDGATPLGTATLDSNGNATLTSSALQLGSQTITAIYDGDSTYGDSSASLLQMVNQAGTSTFLTSNANPAQPGQSVTFTAAVMPEGGSGTPSGTVTFLDGTTTLGTGTLALVSGQYQATFTTAALANGSHTITAVYSGDGTFAASSSSMSETVGQPSGSGSSTYLTSSASPSLPGQAVTLTATVNGMNGTPTGSVAFYDGTTLLGTATLALVNGQVQATLTTAELGLGSHDLLAVYSGDGTYAISAATLTQAVVQAGTTTSLSSSANPSPLGQPVTFTVTISSMSMGAATPTGTVAFYDGATFLGNGTLTLVNGQWQATFTTSALGLGAHNITASYSGDGTFAGSAASLEETIDG